ncbi:MAG: DUF6382 domain-containing protein [Clostridiales bacterium]|nr:DUF6382 domain-containing protein [Clostridiales bacterium]
MIEQEVLYERNMTGSYMKIEAVGDMSFDEKMLFSGRISGILAAEQCFLNGKAWYWYNISGKQSLDTFCKVQEIGISMIEKIIISICDEIEILEWNLFNLNCLLLSPEYIFINNINQEILFTVYPGSEDELSQQFRELMEYLLTKIDHKDVRAVQAAYDIYEKTLDEAYDIMDIRDYIVKGRMQENALPTAESGQSGLISAQQSAVTGNQYAATGQQNVVTGQQHAAGAERHSVTGQQYTAAGRQSTVSVGNEPASKEGLSKFRAGGRKASVDKQVVTAREAPKPAEKDTKKSVFLDIMRILNEWKQSFQRPLQVAERIEYGSDNLSAKDESDNLGAEDGWYGTNYSKLDAERGQTTVLSGYNDFIKGVLVYEGTDGLDNISLRQQSMQIGKLRSSDACIPRNTISQFHARITYKDGDYLLEDLNSTNGTYVNEKPLAYKEIRKLQMNDIVRFADVSYRFV